MHLILFSITLWGDLSGGFDRIADLADMTTRVYVGNNNFAAQSRTTMP